MSSTVAIVGRPNVGKSTLFNRLVGHRVAIVHDTPGITRDRHYGSTKWSGRELHIIDTGGIEPKPDSDLFKSMRAQALAAIEEADVVLLLVDARAGITPMDAEVARMLRSSQAKVLLCANKAESETQATQAMEFYSLGLGEVRPISAEHGLGVADLLDEGGAEDDGDDGAEGGADALGVDLEVEEGDDGGRVGGATGGEGGDVGEPGGAGHDEDSEEVEDEEGFCKGHGVHSMCAGASALAGDCKGSVGAASSGGGR